MRVLRRPSSVARFLLLHVPRHLFFSPALTLTGLYDTWVARDTCGTPFRAFWPYAKDRPTIKLIQKEKVFPVASCWNGAVAVPSGDYLWRPEPGSGGLDDSGLGMGLKKRGWKMVDNC
jgi:hypothetical protein